MQVRRCAHVLVEPRERLVFDLGRLLSGESGLSRAREWVALAAHIDHEIVIDAEQLRVLGALSAQAWVNHDALLAEHARDVIDVLLDHGLLLADDDVERHAELRARDHDVRDSHWLGLSAVTHRHTRWRAIDTAEAERRFGRETDRPFLERLGPPEPAVCERVGPAERIALDRPQDSLLEALLRRRVTCRNYDRTRAVSAQDFATVMYRAFAARAVSDEPGIRVIKRAAPSAGGLHPTEAYVLVQNVEGVQPGIYHYHPIDHALEPLGDLATDDTAAIALRMVAGQAHFQHAHVVIALASRFRRTFWKYRNHAKAHRAVVLDAGHLSQTLYLAATEQGLAAFITAAVNEVDIENLFGLDPMCEGVLAVCGFGWRGDRIDEVEFDPLGEVWPPAS